MNDTGINQVFDCYKCILTVKQDLKPDTDIHTFTAVIYPSPVVDRECPPSRPGRINLEMRGLAIAVAKFFSAVG